MAIVDKKKPPKVCLIDLDLQFGSVATYLDLPRLEPVFELLADSESMDDQMFNSALLNFEDKLSVFTAPSDMIPLDLITSTDIERLLDMVRIRDGIAAECSENVETVAIADLDLTDLSWARAKGTVRNLRDRRFDLYQTHWTDQ